jgi:2-hydroxychromene-2-carboxylate isomerase
LRDNVEELIARGGFGSPTIFVEGAMFFGNDRLPLVEHELAVGVGGALDQGSGGST